jgi:fumarylacetoacetate (FAA) hydrolase
VKLASIPGRPGCLETERRDGRLVIVDDVRGFILPVPADVAPSLREALERWAVVEPALQRLSRDLKAGNATEAKPLMGQRFLAPLPRTTSWLDGSAFIQHILLVRKARGAEPPPDLRTVPLMYQGTGDPLLGPTDDVVLADEAWGLDLEAEVAVVLDDTPMGTTAAGALRHVKLLVLMNDWSLRNLIPRELAAGFGFFQGKPATSFAPYAITQDEAGAAWHDGRLHVRVKAEVNGASIGDPDAGEMHFSFAELIEHAAKTRDLPAGTILGSGTVSNADASRGCGCLAEVRVLEQLKTGTAKTPFLKHGARVRIDASVGGRSLFGCLDQRIVESGGMK